VLTDSHAGKPLDCKRWGLLEQGAAFWLSLRLTSIDAWLTTARDAFARTSGLVPDGLTVDQHTAATVLDLARIAAHTSGERTNAPLLSYLAGLAVAQGANIDDLAAALRDRP
jgi:Domain of unknown function (DUF6457)